MLLHCPAFPASLSLPEHGSYGDKAVIKDVFDRLIVQDGKNHRGLYSGYLATELLLALAEGNAPENETRATQQERL